jgi:hypothetical protein
VKLRKSLDYPGIVGINLCKGFAKIIGANVAAACPPQIKYLNDTFKMVVFKQADFLKARRFYREHRKGQDPKRVFVR